MSNVNILNLPVAVSLSGAEYFPLVQGGTTKRAAVGLLDSFASTGGTQTANTVFAGPTSGSAAAPSFRALVNADIAPGGVALTKTDDTNITLTLGGSATTALVNAASLTLGWTGTLGVARGGTNIASYAVGDILYASGATTLAKLADVATGSVLVSGGVTTAPAWSASPTLTTSLTVPQLYGGSAVGSTLDIRSTSSGSPSGDSTTIRGTTITLRAVAGGTSTVNLGVSGATGAVLNVAGSASGSQQWKPAATASGIITWPAGTVNFSGTGGASQVVQQTSTGGIFTVGQIGFSDLTGSASMAQLGSTSYAAGIVGLRISGVNFNSANTDNAIAVSLPTGFTRYQFINVAISHASATLTTATCGVFTAAAGGGTAVVAGGTAITVSTASDDTNNNMQFVGLFGNNNTTAWSTATTPTIYFRVGTAEGSAATGDVTILLRVIS